jgi:hypothetical protein
MTMTEQDPGMRIQDADVSTMMLVSRLLALESGSSVQALRPLRNRVIERGLRREHLIPAPAEIRGQIYQGRAMRTGDLIDVRRAKYIQHAVCEDQWPAGTTFEVFLETLLSVVDDDRSGVFVSRHPAGWRLTFAAPSDIWEGLEGGPVIVVVYDCREDRLVTSFQPPCGIRYVDDNDQVVDGIWLRRMR